MAMVWAPMRNFIDGGMAAAIREPRILKGTLTFYGDVRQVMRPLGIEDRSTITLVLADGSGTGGFDPNVGQDLLWEMSNS